MYTNLYQSNKSIRKYFNYFVYVIVEILQILYISNFGTNDWTHNMKSILYRKSNDICRVNMFY